MLGAFKRTLLLDRRAKVNVEMSLHLADLVQNQTGRRPAVMPYIWLWPSGTANATSGYGNKPAKGLDLAASVQVPAAMGADGVILWCGLRSVVVWHLLLAFIVALIYQNFVLQGRQFGHTRSTLFAVWWHPTVSHGDCGVSRDCSPIEKAA